MNNLISIETLIEEAEKKGINFGKGDPYNRLRYYTKIGWLPHMIRKADQDGDITGHYPEWALDELIFIENLKDQGVSNEDITKRLRGRNKMQNFANSLSSKETRNQVISYVVLITVLVILANQLEIINIGKPKSSLVVSSEPKTFAQILDSGTSFVPKEQNFVFVKNTNVTKTSKINVTFNQNYAPASRYWISEIKDLQGFTLQLDSPVSEAAEFNWWLSN